MSQNIRAVPGASPRHGSTWKVVGSGRATMSDSCTREKPSIAEPSKPMPSAKAPSSSAGATATDLRKPRTSVNHSRTKRMSRSSIVRRTNSSCLPMRASSYEACVREITGPQRVALPLSAYARVVPQLRIALAQVNPVVGALAANSDLVVESVRAGAAEGAHIVALPELALTGYPVEDLALRKTF